MSTLENTIRYVLPQLDQHRLARLVWRLRALGVVDVIQLSYIRPENLNDILTMAETQQLLAEWQKPEASGRDSPKQQSSGWFQAEPSLTQEHADRFVRAACDGDLGTVHHLLLQGLDVNCYNQNYFTALYNAAQNGFTNAVEYLLRHQANPNLTCASLRLMTPLYTAAARGHHSVCHYLLQYGADVNARVGELGSTPLTVAAERGHVPVISLLIQFKADVNATYGLSGSTALTIAASRGHAEVCCKLLEAGANVNATLKTTGSSALTFAAEKGHVHIVRLLLHYGANTNTNYMNGLNSTIIAAERGLPDVIAELLRGGAAVNKADGVGDTALHCAARKGYWRAARILLQHEADPSIQNQDLMTPLQAAHDDNMRKLIRCYT